MNQEEQKLQEIQNYNGDEEREYIDKTAFKQVDYAIGDSVEYGTIKITDEYAKQAVIAVKSRIDATKKDIEELRNKIKENVKDHELKAMVEGDTKKESVVIGGIRTAAEDWIDDLVEIFLRAPGNIKIKANKNMSQRYLTTYQDADQSDFSKEIGMVYDLFQGKNKEALSTEGITEEQKAALQSMVEKNVYYFSNIEAVKTLVLDGLDKAKYKEKIERLMYNGVVKKMFILKKAFEPRTTKVLKKFDKTETSKEGYLAFGNFNQEVLAETVFNFHVIDPLKVIFRKDKITWVIEEVDFNYYDLLNITLDGEYKPKPNALYDYDRLKQLEEKIKLFQPQVKEPNGIESNDIRKIDGDILIYEAHGIPFEYDVKDLLKRVDSKEKAKGLSPDGKITLLSCLTYIAMDDQYFPVGIQPEMFGDPYLIEVFGLTEDSSYGLGLPEILRPLENFSNKIYNQGYSLLDLAVKGVCFVDKDKLANPDQLSRLKGGEVILLKDLAGSRIEEVVQWLRPPTEALATMVNLMDRVETRLEGLSRKGLTGSKISPNPTATEFTSIMTEMLKPVKRLANRLENLFIRLIEEMYIYSMISHKGNFSLYLQGYKLSNKQPGNVLMNSVSKWCELSPEEVYIDGVAFTVSIIDLMEKEAVQKQQIMQFLDLLYKGGLIDGPDGQERLYIDDSNASVIMNKYNIINTIASYFNIENLWKKKEPIMNPAMGVTPGAPTVPATGAPMPNTQVPPVSSSPDIGQMLAGINGQAA